MSNWAFRDHKLINVTSVHQHNPLSTCLCALCAQIPARERTSTRHRQRNQCGLFKIITFLKNKYFFQYRNLLFWLSVIIRTTWNLNVKCRKMSADYASKQMILRFLGSSWILFSQRNGFTFCERKFYASTWQTPDMLSENKIVRARAVRAQYLNIFTMECR